jgi:hypothetical protein
VLFNEEGKELRERVWKETVDLLRAEAGIDFSVPPKIKVLGKLFRTIHKIWGLLEANFRRGKGWIVMQ